MEAATHVLRQAARHRSAGRLQVRRRVPAHPLRGQARRARRQRRPASHRVPRRAPGQAPERDRRPDNCRTFWMSNRPAAPDVPTRFPQLAQVVPEKASQAVRQVISCEIPAPARAHVPQRASVPVLENAPALAGVPGSESDPESAIDRWPITARIGLRTANSGATTASSGATKFAIKSAITTRGQISGRTTRAGPHGGLLAPIVGLRGVP